MDSRLKSAETTMTALVFCVCCLATTVVEMSHGASAGNTGELGWKVTSSSSASGVQKCSFTVTYPGLLHLLHSFPISVKLFEALKPGLVLALITSHALFL